ncbi:MAG: hypothetical protein OXG85_03160 [Chloroflexi bacterium]|nr:hypothetical protein [Chloroflexota bacterium]
MVVDWQVETLRISVFPEDIDSVSPSKLWEMHIGEPEPEVIIQPGSTNRRNAKYRNGEIYLVKTRSQIDWRYVLPLEDTANENDLPAWGNLELELTGFLEFSQSFLQKPSILPVNRLAFGAVLMRPAKNLLTTCEHLAGLLPRFDLEDVAEFNYLINRRRRSSFVEDLHINRLSRWAAVTLERNTSTLDPVVDGELNPIKRLFASRVELDINTVPVHGTQLPSELLMNLFQELVDMGKRITQEGDVS